MPEKRSTTRLAPFERVEREARERFFARARSAAETRPAAAHARAAHAQHRLGALDDRFAIDGETRKTELLRSRALSASRSARSSASARPAPLMATSTPASVSKHCSVISPRCGNASSAKRRKLQRDALPAPAPAPGIARSASAAAPPRSMKPMRTCAVLARDMKRCAAPAVAPRGDGRRPPPRRPARAWSAPRPPARASTRGRAPRASAAAGSRRSGRSGGSGVWRSALACNNFDDLGAVAGQTWRARSSPGSAKGA